MRAKIPAATSSSTIPVPSGSLSSCRTGGGLTISKALKKYKTRQKSFPRQRDGDQRDELSGDLVDDDELWIFAAGCPRDAGGGGNADERDEQGEGDEQLGSAAWREARKRLQPRARPWRLSPRCRVRGEGVRCRRTSQSVLPNAGRRHSRPRGPGWRSRFVLWVFGVAVADRVFGVGYGG